MGREAPDVCTGWISCKPDSEPSSLFQYHALLGSASPVSRAKDDAAKLGGLPRARTVRAFVSGAVLVPAAAAAVPCAPAVTWSAWAPVSSANCRLPPAGAARGCAPAQESHRSTRQSGRWCTLFVGAWR